jgi:hypothetical protein
VSRGCFARTSQWVQMRGGAVKIQMSYQLVARVARAMCVADGRDPDQLVQCRDGCFGSEPVGLPGGVKYVSFHEAWQSYTGDARRAIAAHAEITASMLSVE